MPESQTEKQISVGLLKHTKTQTNSWTRTSIKLPLKTAEGKEVGDRRLRIFAFSKEKFC